MLNDLLRQQIALGIKNQEFDPRERGTAPPTIITTITLSKTEHSALLAAIETQRQRIVSLEGQLDSEKKISSQRSTLLTTLQEKLVVVQQHASSLLNVPTNNTNLVVVQQQAASQLAASKVLEATLRLQIANQQNEIKLKTETETNLKKALTDANLRIETLGMRPESCPALQTSEPITATIIPPTSSGLDSVKEWAKENKTLIFAGVAALGVGALALFSNSDAEISSE